MCTDVIDHVYMHLSATDLRLSVYRANEQIIESIAILVLEKNQTFVMFEKMEFFSRLSKINTFFK